MFDYLHVEFWHRSTFSGILSDGFGRRSVILTGLTLYFAASLTIALIGSIHLLLILRVIEGLGAGCITSVARAVVNDTHEDNHSKNSPESLGVLNLIISLITLVLVMAIKKIISSINSIHFE